MPKKKILFLYTGGHRVHKEFARGVTKDSKSSCWKLPKDYDFYFNEGEFFKPVFLRMFGLINKQSKIIALFSDPRLFYFDKKIRFNTKKQKLEKYPLLRRSLFKFVLKKLDGAICVGKFQRDLLRKYFKGPIKVVYPFIEEKKQKKINTIKPSLKDENVLFVTTWGDHYCKGLDFVIEIFDELKRKLPNIKMYILGKVNRIEGGDKEGLFFEGFKKIENYLKKSSLTIHFGRGESFGINILESLLAGVPTIVSEYTGAKEVVEKINPKFVVPLDKKTAIKAILDYFNLSKEKKKRLSLRGRKLASDFKKANQTKNFKKKFEELIYEIEKKRGYFKYMPMKT